MANVRICVCHPSEEHCQAIIQAFREFDEELELVPVVDLRGAMKTIGEEEPAVCVVGVDAPNDPALRTVEAINSGGGQQGVVVVSQDPSQELLVACLRAGCDEFLEFPIKVEELRKALEGLYRKKGLVHGSRGKITAVYSAKGGVGATTIACNLAAEIARVTDTDAAACVLDLNLQFGSVALFMDLREFSYSLADACRDADRLDTSLLRSYMSHHASGAAVLPAPLNVEELEEIDPARLSTVVGVCRNVYDHVLLDLPHGIDALTMAGFDLADQVLLVCDIMLPTIRNTIRAVKMFQELDYKKNKFKLIINRYDDGHQISLAEVAEHVQLPVFWTVPYDSPVAISATNSGQTFADTASGSAATHSLTALAQTVAGLPINKPGKKRRRLFARKR